MIENTDTNTILYSGLNTNIIVIILNNSIMKILSDIFISITLYKFSYQNPAQSLKTISINNSANTI